MSDATLLLIRPRALSERSANEVRRALPNAKIIVSPVLEIRAVAPPPDLTKFAGIIATSQNVAQFLPDLNKTPAFVVGARTADALRERGAQVEQVFETADALIAGLNTEGPLLHLRGKHTRGDVKSGLCLAGIETDDAVIYDQAPLPPTAQARAIIASNARLVLPLYSPRSAALIAPYLRGVRGKIHAIAMSDAVADVWQDKSGLTCDTLKAPLSRSMLQSIVTNLRQ